MARTRSVPWTSRIVPSAAVAQLARASACHAESELARRLTGLDFCLLSRAIRPFRVKADFNASRVARTRPVPRGLRLSLDTGRRR